MSIQPVMEDERDSSGLLPFLVLLSSLNLIKKRMYEWGEMKRSLFKIFLERNNFVHMTSVPRPVCKFLKFVSF